MCRFARRSVAALALAAVFPPQFNAAWPTFRESIADATREALEEHFALVPLMQGR